MNQKTIKTNLAVLSVGLLALALMGCSHHGDEKLEAKTLHIHLLDDVKTLDPASAYDSISNDVGYQISEALYQYDYLTEGFKVIPLLAADLPSFSKDRKTVTIPLRHDIRYQDDPCFTATYGKARTVTSKDFVLSIKRLAHPLIQSEGWWTVDGKIVGMNAFHDKLVQAGNDKKALEKAFSEDIEGVVALDEFTLQLKLTRPYPQLTQVLAMNFFSPTPIEALTKYTNEVGQIVDHPVGTGPFMLKRWQRQRRLELVRNLNYHEEHFPIGKKGTLLDAGKLLPFVERLVFDVIKESQPAWLNFLKGSLDSLVLPKDNFQQAVLAPGKLSSDMTEKGIKLEVEKGTSFYWITFNTQDSLLKNKYLRQALSSAIDRQKWLDTFTNGTGEKMDSLIPPSLADRPKKPKLKFDYDLAQAKELLKKAGYPGGEGLAPINFDLRGSDTYSRQLGDFFTQQWSAIGVKVNVILNTFPAFLEKQKVNNLQISFGGWNLDYPDAENVAQLLYGPNKAPGPNDSAFNHPEMNRLYEQMATLDPGPARAQIIQKMDDIVQEECPWALGYYRTAYELVQPWIFNYRSGDSIPNRYKYFRIDAEIRRRHLYASPEAATTKEAKQPVGGEKEKQKPES